MLSQVDGGSPAVDRFHVLFHRPLLGSAIFGIGLHCRHKEGGFLNGGNAASHGGSE